MKFIHIGDLHIGKIIHEFSMLEDQKYALNKLITLIKEEEVDALVIAGDLYDRSVPPSNAVEVLSDFFTTILRETKAKILVVAGNHDSGERLSFLQKILEKEGLYIEGSYNGDVKKVTLKDVDFYLLPYTDPAEVRKLHKNPDIKTHDDAMRFIVESIKPKGKSVLIAHAFVGKESLSSDSERPLNIGNAEIVDHSIFNDFTYTALGHLHRAQKVGEENIRYSGSLLKYSVSESIQEKSVTVVNINEDSIDITLKKLDLLRDLRVIKGYLDDIVNPENYAGENLDDYVFAELLDEGELIDPIGTLRGVYKNVLGLRKASREKDEVNLNNTENYRKKGVDELFLDFYLEFNEGLNEERKEEMLKVINEAAKEVTL